MFWNQKTAQFAQRMDYNNEVYFVVIQMNYCGLTQIKLN